MPAATPNPPYYSLALTTIVSPGTLEIFTKLNEFVKETTPKARGFLGLEEAKGQKEWITILYWTDREAIDEWSKDLRVFAAKHPTLMMAFLSSKARIAKVEKALP
ncbi:hypothetical protein MUN46_007235 [Mesosutterella sp. AGMB02718]|uniref:ABM domain-containing protein n=1 Tax=Mesosutterella faecium TaxID=2925194 RepID=A0ABT7IP99_9BURK|nr:hypothetical protein [Mesosutterella sp. AGMB02718]MDL2059718.1 hypothetical protein [Mesosutterella sp. AGMB02718]